MMGQAVSIRGLNGSRIGGCDAQLIDFIYFTSFPLERPNGHLVGPEFHSHREHMLYGIRLKRAGASSHLEFLQNQKDCLY